MIEKKRRQKEKKTPEAGCITVLGVTVVLTANVVCGAHRRVKTLYGAQCVLQAGCRGVGNF